MRLWLDTETYSDVDLRKHGPARYMASPAFELMVCTWAIDHGPVQYADLTHPAGLKLFRDEFITAFCEADEIVAANAPFDRAVLHTAYGLDAEPEAWRCLTVKAYRAGLPRGGLDYVAKHVGLAGKLPDGKRLIQRFCKPRKPSKHKPWTRNLREHYPDDWALFLAYAMQDVEVMREAYWLLPDCVDSKLEEATRAWDWRVNERGLRIDMDAVAAANGIIDTEVALLDQRMRMTTGGRVSSTNAVQALLPELRARGAVVEDTTADTLRAALDSPLTPPAARDLITLRLEAARATNGKWRALRDRVTGDRLYWHLQYYGAARTGRWSGRGVQTHNLIRTPKGVDARTVAEVLAQHPTREQLGRLCPGRPVLEYLAYGIRGAFIADEGHTFVRGDLSQIEARKVSWLAHNDPMLAVFADPDKDPYMEQALSAGSQDRQLGKVLVLACGFGVQGETFLEQAANYGVTGLTVEDANRFVGMYREQNRPIVDYWYAVDAAFCDAIEHPGHEFKVFDCTFGSFTLGSRRWAYIQLPSGRQLLYADPVVETVVRNGRPRRQASYLGEKGRTRTYGAKLVENITQAGARDMLAYAALNIEAHGVPIYLHVHDEVVGQVLDRYVDAGLQVVQHWLTQQTPWTQSRPVPLGAEVGATKRYAKL